MDQARFTEALMRLEHRHSDGSWSPLEPRPQHHDSVKHDPERTWAGGQLYVCSTCDEQVVVRNATDDDHH
jgi:hypothetical protein